MTKEHSIETVQETFKKVMDAIEKGCTPQVSIQFYFDTLPPDEGFAKREPNGKFSLTINCE